MPKGLFGGSAPTIASPQHGALFNTADAMLGGWLSLGGKMSAKQAARAAAAEEEAAFRQRVQGQFGDDPVAMIAATANPGEFGKNLATGYGAANVSGGDSRVFGNPARGGSVYTAPKLGIDGGQGYTQTPEEMRVTGARGPSIAERQAEFKNAADIDAEIQRLQIAKGQLAVQQGQLGINRDAYNARLRGVGGFGTPGVGGGSLGSGDLPDGPGWE